MKICCRYCNQELFINIPQHQLIAEVCGITCERCFNATKPVDWKKIDDEWKWQLEYISYFVDQGIAIERIYGYANLI